MSKKGITMRCHTIGLVAMLAFALLVAPLTAEAQQPGNVRHIGVLLTGSPLPEVVHQPAFLQFLRGLHELGWVEGHTIAIEYRWAHGQSERLPDLAAELVQLQVEVIVAFPAASALAAKHVTSTVPIVFLVGTDPVALGLASSLARPGGNLTGVASFTRDLMGKRLELLKEAVPGATRVAVWFHPGDAIYQTPALREAQAREVRSLGIMLRWLEVRAPNEFEEAFSVMSRERLDAFVLASGAVFYDHRTRIVDLAAQHRLPAMYIARGWVDAGGLMSYAASFSSLWQRVAVLVDKILKGAKPAALPVEQPVQFELVINLKTAKELGLTIPPTLLFQADEVLK